MVGDVDPEGWSYAFMFRSKKWRHKAYPFHSFVRRRRWIRLRRKKNSEDIKGQIYKMHPIIQETPAEELESMLNVEPKNTVLADFDQLKEKVMDSRIDREKLEFIKEYLDRNPSDEPNHVSQNLSLIGIGIATLYGIFSLKIKAQNTTRLSVTKIVKL